MRVAVDEVEDAVRAGPGAVDEVGPGDRALRRNAGAQIAEAARRPQLGQVGEQALAASCFRTELRVHAVDADDDDLLARGSATRGGRCPANSAGAQAAAPTAAAAAAGL